MNKYHLYLHFPSDPTTIFSNKTEYQAMCDDVEVFVDRADCEKESCLYFDDENVEMFLDFFIEHATEIGIGDYEAKYLTTNVYDNWLENAKNFKDENLRSTDSGCTYTNYEAVLGTELHDILFEAAASASSSLREKDATAIVDLYKSLPVLHRPVPIVKDCTNINDGTFPVFVPVRCLHSLEGLDLWFQKKQEKRILNTEDQRHNEESPFYIKGKSPLLRNYKLQTDIDAVEILLKKALTDQYAKGKNTKNIKKDLVAFDEQKQRYIWFEAEVTGNRYHAYHLAYPKKHERDRSLDRPSHDRKRDDKGEGKIPARIKRLLHILQNAPDD